MQEITAKELRKSLRSAMSDHLKQIGETLNKVEPKERLEFIIRLMPYAFPKDDDSDIFNLNL
ncbi:MAG: hypothetical protein WC957_02060 [Candidatus Neomarinimicrobiota bacterium]|jgi:hypothetical protein